MCILYVKLISKEEIVLLSDDTDVIITTMEKSIIPASQKLGAHRRNDRSYKDMGCIPSAITILGICLLILGGGLLTIDVIVGLMLMVLGLGLYSFGAACCVTQFRHVYSSVSNRNIT